MKNYTQEQLDASQHLAARRIQIANGLCTHEEYEAAYEAARELDATKIEQAPHKLAMVKFFDAAEALASAFNAEGLYDSQYYLEGLMDRLQGHDRDKGVLQSDIEEVKDYRDGYNMKPADGRL